MEEFDEIRKELEETAPELAKLNRVNLFKVDNQYFETLPTAIMNKVHEKRYRKLIIDLSWLLQPKWAATVAVCFIFIIGSISVFRKINADKPMPLAKVQQLLSEPVSTEAVIDNIDEDVLIDAVAAAPKPENKKSNTKKSSDKKALEQYILDNVDESSLTDEL